MTDFSKEPIRIGHVILWRKGWYQHTSNNWEFEPTMKDIREMLKYDGYEPQFLSDKEVMHIIFRTYDEYFKWAYLHDVPGFYDPLMSVITGTYHNCYNENPFAFNIMLEILAKFAWTENKYLKLPIPHYDKNTYKIGCYKPGMTYTWMNKHAKEIFEKNGKD